MSRLNFSDNKINDGIAEVRKANSKTKWVLFGMPDKGTRCQFLEKGEDHDDLVAEMVEEGADKIVFAYIRWQVGTTGSFKYVLIALCGNGVKMAIKRNMITYNRDLDDFMRGKVHVKIDARNEDDLDEDFIDKKVKKAAGTLFLGDRMLKGVHGKDWKAAKNVSQNKAFKGTHGKDWRAAKNVSQNKAFKGNYGKDWRAAKNVSQNKAFQGTHGKDWKANKNVSQNKAFAGTHGNDWKANKNVSQNKAFAGTHGNEWETKKNVSQNKAFAGEHGDDWQTQENQQVSQAFSGEHGEEWVGEGEQYEGEEYYEEQPQEETYEEQPQEETYEEQPQEETYEEQPQEETYEEQPQEETYEEQPQEETYEEQPQEETYEEQPQEESYQETYEEQPQEETEGGKTAVVMFDFEGSDGEELSVKEGETVTVLKDVGEWLYCSRSDGSEGYVPTTYVEMQ